MVDFGEILGGFLQRGEFEMQTVVIYRSKTGFVKKYAEWLAEALSADVFEASQVTPDIFAQYDTVIYGGGLYAVGINGVKFITQNLDKLEGKKVVVFAVGVSPVREESLTEVKNKNFAAEQQKKIQFFYLRGGFDYHKLRWTDKILMSILKRSIMNKAKKKKELTADEKGLLEVFERPVDYTVQDNIKEIVAYVHSQETSGNKTKE